MTDRVVKVSLQAQVSNYIANMEAASKSTKKVTGTLEQQKAASIAAAKAQGEAAQEIGRGMVAVGALAAVGVALAVKKFADFDEALSNVKAATQETSENMSLLRDAALDAGARTVFSATEAANAIEELGKAGLTTKQILGGGLDGALSLAAAGQLGVAEAAGIAAIAVKQFNLEGADVPHVADLLAAGAGKAVGDVRDLSAALGQAGLVANGAGQSIEDTTGVLSAFADAGLLGSDAGTSLKSAIIALQAPTAKSQAVMDRYNLSFYDGAGNMLSYTDIAGQLETKLGTLDDETRNAALAQIFGNDALRSANVLYEQGAKGIQGYVDQTNDSGYAAKVAADRLNNLKGDVEQLGGAFDTYLIKSGSGANDMLRALTQGATGVVTAVGALPEPVLNGGLALTGLVAAIALAGGAALIAVPKVAQFKVALSTLGISGGSAARGIGLASGALAAAGFAFALWAAKQAEATATASEFANSLDEATGATTEYTRELVAKKLAEEGAFDAARDVGISQKELTDAVLEGGDALASVRDRIGENTQGWTLFSAEGVRAGSTLYDITQLTEGLATGSKNLTDEQAASTDGTQDATTAYQDAANKAAELQSNLSALIDTINEANGVGQDAVSQNIAYQDALAELDAQIAEIAKGTEGYSLGIGLNTEAGRTNLGMLNDLAGQSQAAAKAQFDLDQNTDSYKATLEAGRQAVIDRAIALGATADEAQLLADKIYAIPPDAHFTMIAETAEAQRRLDAIKRTVESFRASNSTVTAYVREVGGRAEGGAIHGPGGPRDDKAGLYRLSNGEHVLDAEDVTRMGGQSGVYAFRESLYRGMANGGHVGYVQPTYAPPAPQYMREPATSGALPPVQVVVSSKGGVDLLKYIDVSVQNYDAQVAAETWGGAR